MVLPNIIIGNNVIIGAGAVITQNLPDNCVAVGVPAKIIKQNKMKERIKIFHIHSDPKFILDIDAMYNSDFFENKLIYVGEEIYDIENSNYIGIQFKPIPENIGPIIEVLKRSDVVVVNFLDEYKSQIVNKIPKNIKIIWRFFGIEFYMRRQNIFLSEQTRKNVKEDLSIIKRFRILKNKIYNKNDVAFFRAVKRIDYITSFCIEEYDLLKRFWKIPKFLKISVEYDVFINKQVSYSKEPKIILGNNKHNFNNHIDLINIVNNATNTDVDFLMFFSYGGEGVYQSKVRDLSLQNSKIQLIENFLQKKDFDKIYEKSSAFVHNGYRQMALGNIFTAICFGLKVYLNEENVIYKWLTKEGLLISSITELENDLNNNNYSLARREIDFNIEMYNSLIANYNVKKFQENLLKIIR